MGLTWYSNTDDGEVPALVSDDDDDTIGTQSSHDDYPFAQMRVKRQLKQTVHAVHHLYVVATLGADRTGTAHKAAMMILHVHPTD